MRILIKNGVVQQNQNDKFVYKPVNIVVKDDKIIAIDDQNESLNYQYDKIIDAKGCVVIPGLVNAHLHSYDQFHKGAFDNLPLEVWALYKKPIFSGFDHTPDELYLRTLFGCIEMIKTGTTTIIDDVVQCPDLDEKNLEMIFKAYEKAGLRAFVTTHLLNKPFHKTIPFLEDSMSSNIKHRLSENIYSEEEILSYFKSTLQKYNTEDALQQYALSPSGPQRCTLELLNGVRSLSEEYNAPVILHSLETKIQNVTAHEFYKKTMIEYLSQNNLLYPNLSLVHSVWVNDTDIDLIAESGSKVIHNPTSNLKLGSGIAPIRNFLEKEVTVGLGTDNTVSNDSHNMFELMKITALIHKIKDENYEKWIGAQEALKMATLEGAKCALLDDKIGSIEVNKKADMVILDTENYRFIPKNDYTNQLVFCENGSSVKTALINGKVVLEDGEITTFNEKEVLKEMNELLPRVLVEERKLAQTEAELVVKNVQNAYFKSHEMFNNMGK